MALLPEAVALEIALRLAGPVGGAHPVVAGAQPDLEALHVHQWRKGEVHREDHAVRLEAVASGQHRLGSRKAPKKGRKSKEMADLSRDIA